LIETGTPSRGDQFLDRDSFASVLANALTTVDTPAYIEPETVHFSVVKRYLPRTGACEKEDIIAL
jgi:hypothetical protein